MNIRPVGLTALFLLSACASAPQKQWLSGDATSAAAPGAVLMVLSAAPTQRLADGRARATGYFLNEFYEPYRALTEAGYSVVIATPDGKPASLDPESLNGKYWKDHPSWLPEAIELEASLPALQRPRVLADVVNEAASFQGLVVPGGQGVMVDLIDNPDLHSLIATMQTSDRPIGLICHAPAVLARMPALSSLAGARVTSVSGMEEWYIETFVMGAEAEVREIEDLLGDAGFRHESAFAGRAHAVRDCNLVTSQNPFSGSAFGKLFMDALSDWRGGGRCVGPNELAQLN